MTVSRVVNDSARVSEETRDQVRLAIRQLNYTPNVAARRLAAGDSISIGLVYDDPGTSYFAELLLGSLEASSAAGARLVLERGGGAAADQKAVRRLIEQGVQAMLLPPPFSDNATIIDLIESAGLPMVAVATSATPPHGAAVGIDDFAAARTVTARLLELGHTRIGFICGRHGQTASAARLEGYLSALSAAGVDRDDALITGGEWSFATGLVAARELLNRPRRPSAILASNDDMAIAVIAVAGRMRISVPEELSVAGFDDTPMALATDPALATVRQPINEMGRWAIGHLLSEIRAIRAGKEAGRVLKVMNFELLERGSIGPPSPAA